MHREAFDTTLMEQCQSDDELNVNGRNGQERATVAASIRESLVTYCTENRIGQNWTKLTLSAMLLVMHSSGLPNSKACQKIINFRLSIHFPRLLENAEIV